MPSPKPQAPIKTRTRTRATGTGPVHYRVEVAHLQAHIFNVTLTLAQPQAQQVLQLPSWIPGSYLMREFAKHLQKLQCRQAGRVLPHQQLDKARWQVDCTPGVALEVCYEVYAFDNSVRTAWLDGTRGFFNGTSLFVQAVHSQALAHTLELVASPAIAHWQVATGLDALRTNKAGFGLYHAPDYDTLVDCPVEMGTFWSGDFNAYGVPHRLVVAGAPPSFDGARLLADTQAICETQMRFWHGSKPRKSIPFQRYVFLLNAAEQGYGGLEHRNSTALISPRSDLPRLARDTLAPTVQQQPEGYTTLLGLISHEYFHTWNVKRLRPATLTRYDYGCENYTDLLWFFEGFTSYYDDLLLCRAQRMDSATYLKLLGKTINQVLQTPGRLVQTVAQASMDAWIKYYRPDENTANATVSYYTKGALVALCLDLTLRHEGKTTLDDVMRALWQRCHGGPMTQDDVLAVLQQCSGRSFAKEIARWVHSTAELPLKALLELHGVAVHQEPSAIAQQLGLRVKEDKGVHIQQVLRDSAAEKAGFASGDEWLAVQALGTKARSASPLRPNGPWRMQRLDDVLLYAGQAKKVSATVARDGLLRTLELTLPATSYNLRCSVRDPALVKRWCEADGA